MSTEDLKLVYVIQNGQFNGTKQTATIQVSGAGTQAWRAALDAVITTANVSGSFISLYLYAKSVRGSGAAFREIGTRLATLENPIPDVALPLVPGGEVELGTAYEIATMEPVIPEATAAVVADGALDAAAAASIVPGVGWVVAGSVLALGALISGGLTVYDIVNSGETPLVSVVFINGVPNSKFKFTKANWSSGMALVGGDTKKSMLVDKAVSTMETAGSLQFTWQAGGATPNGTATLAFDFDSGTSATADIVWSIDPNTGTHQCTLTGVSGGDLLTALCWKEPVKHNGKEHYVLLYLIVPTTAGAARASFTVKPDKPLVFDNMWARINGGLVFGLYPPAGPHAVLKVPFVVSDYQSYILRDILLPIGFYKTNDSQINEAIIEVCTDENGSPGAPIETLTVPNLGPTMGPVMTIPSVTKPLLQKGQTYWITANMSDDKSAGIWCNSVNVVNPVESTNGLLFSVGGDPVA